MINRQLTEREQEVKQLIEQGRLNRREVAQLLGISPSTVKTHLFNLRLKERYATRSREKISILR